MQKSLTEMNLQLQHVVTDITGATGMRIIRAIIGGERNPAALALLRDTRCHAASIQSRRLQWTIIGQSICSRLSKLWRSTMSTSRSYPPVTCGSRPVLKQLSSRRGRKEEAIRLPRRRTIRQSNGPAFDVQAALYALLGKDVTQIHGLGPYVALKLVAECGDDLAAWPSAKHFTSWLCLAPSNKISGGKVLSSRTRRSGSRAAALLRLAAVSVGRTETALGAFYRRLSARIGKAKAVTATARKIAVLFYNALRHGMDYIDPGASYYEIRYRERVICNLRRRAKPFGYVLQAHTPAPEPAAS
jgi:transposase